MVPGTRGAGRPTTPRPRAWPRAGRLSRDDQGGHGRRRQGHAPRARGRASWRARCARARAEAGAAFGDAAVYLERYVEEPRHIEIQVLADAHGTRGPPGRARVLDPAPAPEARRGVPVAGRRRRSCARAMGEAACRRRRAPSATSTRAPSSSSSTGERNFYFLEMNTRLQVEHPVTELVTGRDLVAEQLRHRRGRAARLRSGRRHLARMRRSSAGSTPRIRSRDSLPSPGRISAPARARRALGARRLRRLRGLHRAALLRHAHGQADRVGARPRRPRSRACARALGEYQRHRRPQPPSPCCERIVADAEFAAGRLHTASWSGCSPPRGRGRAPAAGRPRRRRARRLRARGPSCASAARRRRPAPGSSSGRAWRRPDEVRGAAGRRRRPHRGRGRSAGATACAWRARRRYEVDARAVRRGALVARHRRRVHRGRRHGRGRRLARATWTARRTGSAWRRRRATSSGPGAAPPARAGRC